MAPGVGDVRSGDCGEAGILLVDVRCSATQKESFIEN